MGIATEILGNQAGAPHRIEHDGEVFEVSLIDQRAKAAFEEMLFERAQRLAELTAKRKPEGWLESELARLNEEFLAGEFGLVSQRGLSVLKTSGGVQMLMAILTGRGMAALAGLVTAKAPQLKAMIHLVIRESFPGVKLAEGKPDPN